ncbi:MAG: hypothetical protein ACK5NK_03070, partial [Niabella sp.]
TGCVARVSFSRTDNRTYGKNTYAGYGYQLGVYQLVCHRTEHVPKIVDEYNTVLRIDINPSFPQGIQGGGTGEFYIKYGNPRYNIPIEAKLGPGFENDKKNNPIAVSKYISERMLLTNRSNAYKSYHDDFLKLNNGEGYTENWIRGDRYAKTADAAGYCLKDRRYLILKPGVPLLVPVSRKQYLEDMLEYFEIEKANFFYRNAEEVKKYSNDNSDFAKKYLVGLNADRDAYPKLYEAKKATAKELLANKKTEWLERQAIIEYNNATKYDGTERVKALDKFYESESEYTAALYVLNPEYTKLNNDPVTKPKIIEVEFRYDNNKDNRYSDRLIRNFEKNFDFDALRKMMQ